MDEDEEWGGIDSAAPDLVPRVDTSPPPSTSTETRRVQFDLPSDEPAATPVVVDDGGEHTRLLCLRITFVALELILSHCSAS